MIIKELSHCLRGLVSPPHVLISADQNYAYTFSSHFGWKATQQWPTQHHSALISTDQSAQHWSELFSAESLKAVIRADQSTQCWITECWTELSFTSVEQSLLLKIRFAHTRSWTLSLGEEVTWPKTRNIQLHHAAVLDQWKLVHYMGHTSLHFKPVWWLKILSTQQ